MGLLAAVLLTALSLASPGDDGDRHAVTLDASDDPPDGVPVVGDLADGDVLVMRVTDGDAGAEAVVHQCARRVDSFGSCRNPFPVLFDDEGRATFQYQVLDPGECGRTGSCTLVIDEPDGDVVAWAFLVFGGPAPDPPTITLSPPGPYEPGQTVDVSVSGLPPGTAADVAVCGDTCVQVERATADGDGTASASVRVPEACDDCRVVTLASASRATARLPVARATVDYAPARLVAGLAAAAALLILAWRIVASVDWRPPSEAATPELDAADPTIPRSVV